MNFPCKIIAEILIVIHAIKGLMIIAVPVYISTISTGGEFSFSAFLGTQDAINNICLENASLSVCRYISYSSLVVSIFMILLCLLYLIHIKKRKILLFLGLSVYVFNWLLLLIMGRQFEFFSLDGVLVLIMHIYFIWQVYSKKIL
jgi:hypothetical protein